MTEGSLVFDQWETENLRVSLFPPSPTELWEDSGLLTGLWEGVTDAKPDSVDSRPKGRITKVGGNTAEGSLLLVGQRNKIDWLVVGEPTSVFPELRDVNGVLDLLRKATERSLGKFAQVQRLAMGAVLMAPVRDPTQGLKQLSQFLPRLELDSMEGVDFIYRVNRRRRSTVVPHVRINRLAKWSIVQAGNLQITLDTEPALNTSTVRFARRLELDINNDPRAGVMGRAKIPELLDEFVSLASELSLKGDIP